MMRVTRHVTPIDALARLFVRIVAVVIVAIAVLILAACEFRITEPAPVVAPPATPALITITNTNTNTNTSDRSDTEPTATPAPPTGGGGSTTNPLPLPSYGETVTRDVAAANPSLLANSCQETSGERAWEFLDLVIRTLRAQAQDSRWGYLCKDANCLAFGRDVVAYRASAGDTGIWIVDVIGGHCPGPTDGPPQVRWGVLPFETVRKWKATR
jgi:hypothetical protein